MLRQRERHIPHHRPIMRMRPHIIHVILPPRSNRPALSEIEEHLSRHILRVKDHEYDAVAGVAGPVLRRVRAVGGIVRVDAPAERADALAYMRILVDLDEIFVPKNFDRFFRSIREIGSDYERGFEERPGCEVALGFFESEVSWWCSLARIANLHDIQVVMAVEI